MLPGQVNQISSLLPFFLQLGLLDLPQEDYHPTERTGPFVTWYQWKTLDFEFPTEEDRQSAIDNEEFIPENNLPLGLEVYKERLFVTMPKWKPGVPATLAVLPRKPKEPSPKLVPYPNWDYHTTGKKIIRKYLASAVSTHSLYFPFSVCPFYDQTVFAFPLVLQLVIFFFFRKIVQ